MTTTQTARTLPPLPPGADALSLTAVEELAVRSAVERVRRTGATGRRRGVEARTAMSLLLGRSSSARRADLVRVVIEAAT